MADRCFFLLLPGNSWSYQPLCPQFVRVGHKQSEWWFYFTALHLSRNPQWSLEHHWQLGDQLFSPPVSYSRIQGSLLLWKIKKKDRIRWPSYLGVLNFTTDFRMPHFSWTLRLHWVRQNDKTTFGFDESVLRATYSLKQITRVIDCLTKSKPILKMRR